MKLIENDEEKIKDICKRLNIDFEINSFKDGYNTLVTDSTLPLSLKKQTNKDKKKAIKQFRKNVFKDIKNDINNKKINFDLKHNKKYSSLLKKYLLAE